MVVGTPWRRTVGILAVESSFCIAGAGKLTEQDQILWPTREHDASRLDGALKVARPWRLEQSPFEGLPTSARAKPCA